MHAGVWYDRHSRRVVLIQTEGIGEAGADIQGRFARQTYKADIQSRHTRQTYQADIQGRHTRQTYKADTHTRRRAAARPFLAARCAGSHPSWFRYPAYIDR